MQNALYSNTGLVGRRCAVSDGIPVPRRSPVKKPKAKAAPKAKAGGKPAAAKSSRGARKKKEPAEEDQYGDY